MNLSNRRGNFRVLSIAVGLGLCGLAGGVSPVRAQESAAAKALPLAEIADAARIEKAVRAAHGKVVILNFWASWNAPSAAQYPAFVFLYDRYHAEGLEVISVATDPVKERENRVIPFIQSYKTHFPTFQKDDSDPAAFLAAVDNNWSGTLPRTYILGRDGGVRQTLTTRINPERFEAMLRRLLKEEPLKPKRTNSSKSNDSKPPARNPNGFIGGAKPYAARWLDTRRNVS